ncbi:hypothetical protein ACWU37_20885 (plasmid) [Photobacterium damselae subsp. damselae]|uniref:hypothetical protein n=1 Tax=Photobacterium damselae TaxID=38293 RepID=UPI001F476F4C|nr:hypothetical protein [Photobacterium damselae]UKA12845.1 hypothetical protein IHC91_20865 [Photobacterium damselae subsp. damselae]
MINKAQLDVLTKHLATKPEIALALQYVFIEGMSMYAAEQAAGLSANTLSKKVSRVKRELDYIKAFSAAKHKNEDQQQLTVLDL